MFVRPLRRILPAALALLIAATAIAAEGSVPAGYQVQGSTALANGVNHEVLTLADPAQSVQVARVAPGSARFVAVSSHDTVANQTVGAELPSDMCRRVGCYAGINADSTVAGQGEPVGGVVSGGRLLRSPVPGRSQLNVTRDGRLSAGPLDWSGSVSGNGRTLTIGGVNVGPRPGEVFLYTPAWGDITPEGADFELLVRSSGAIGMIGATTALEVVGPYDALDRIPAGAAVLAASGSAAATLHDWVDRAAAGDRRPLELRIRTALDVVESVGGSPVVLRDGQPAFPDFDDSFTRARHPRSLVGWNAAGEVVLVAVDAGREGASGMTLAEAADLLRGLGATDGFGFDNAAVTFVAAGEVKNLPVDDGYPGPNEGREVSPGHFERPAVNAFMVVPKPDDPPPAPPSTNPGTGTGTKPGTGGTTATTAPKLTTAGGGGPATGGVAAPVAGTGGSSILGGTVSDILKNPGTKRPRRQTTKHGKGKTATGDEPEEEYTGDPSIPDWNDITAALTPEAVAAAEEAGEQSLSLGVPDGEGTEHDYAAVLLQLIAAGMISTVIWGLRRVHEDTRARPALWF